MLDKLPLPKQNTYQEKNVLFVFFYLKVKNKNKKKGGAGELSADAIRTVKDSPTPQQAFQTTVLIESPAPPRLRLDSWLLHTHRAQQRLAAALEALEEFSLQPQLSLFRRTPAEQSCAAVSE